MVQDLSSDECGSPSSRKTFAPKEVQYPHHMFPLVRRAHEYFLEQY